MQRCPSFCVWTCRQLTRKKIKRSERIASQGLSGVRRNDSHRVAGQKVLPRGEGHFLRRLGAVHGAAPRVSPSISRTLTRCSSTRACHLSIASDRSKTRCPGEFSRSVPFGICGERRGVAAFRRAPLSNSGHRPTLSNSRNAGTDARISAKTRQQLLCAVQYLAPHLLRRGLEPLLVFLCCAAVLAEYRWRVTNHICGISLVSEVESMSRIAPCNPPGTHARWWSTWSVRRVSLPLCRTRVASYAVGNDIGRQRPRAVELAARLTTAEHSAGWLWERAPRQWALENVARCF